MQYVYLLKCSDSKTYVGCTNNLEDPVRRHNARHVDATKERLPVILKCYFAFDDQKTAFKFEKYLKTGSGRAFLKKHFFGEVA